jgi:CBS-domain-containing membrane protein
LEAAALARRAMAVPRDLPLGVALDRMAAEGAGGLVVVDGDGRPVAIGNEAAIAAVPEQRRPWVTVGSVSRSLEPGATVSVGLAGEDLLIALSEHPAPEYLVVDDSGAIFGVLTAGDVNHALGRP